MGITNNDRLTDSLANRYSPVPYFPGTMGTLVAGRIYSMWLAGSIFGGIGAVPPAPPGAACDNTTSGAVPVPTPAGGDTVHELPLQLAAGGAGAFYVIDRLHATSGINGNSTALQTLNTSALPTRATGGDLVFAAIEVGATGAGATPVGTTTLTYTSSAGNGSRVGITNFTTPFNSVRSFFPLFCQAGDIGVRSVQSIQFGTLSGSTGDLWLVLCRWISREGLIAAGGGQTGQTLYDQGLPPVDPTACPELLFMAQTTTFPTVFGGVPFVSG